MDAIFQALAAPRRREILRLIWEGERSAGEIHAALPDITFGAVSQHLRILEDARLATRREQGRFRYYAARRRELGHLGKWLEEMWDHALSELKRHAEAEEGSRKRPRAGGPRG